MVNLLLSKIWTNIQSDYVLHKFSKEKISQDQTETDQPFIPDQVWQQSLGEILDDICLVSRLNVHPEHAVQAVCNQGSWILAGESPDTRLRRSSFNASALCRFDPERPKSTSWPISIRQQTALQLSAGLEAHRGNRGGTQ